MIGFIAFAVVIVVISLMLMLPPGKDREKLYVVFDEAKVEYTAYTPKGRQFADGSLVYNADCAEDALEELSKLASQSNTAAFGSDTVRVKMWGEFSVSDEDHVLHGSYYIFRRGCDRVYEALKGMEIPVVRRGNYLFLFLTIGMKPENVMEIFDRMGGEKAQNF